MIDMVIIYKNTIILLNVLYFQEQWTNCQTNWLYLEPIFSAPDIQRQLPAEAKMFLIVDKSWKAVMRRTAKVHLSPGTIIIIYIGMLCHMSMDSKWA